jgi:hydroxymethylpyrimidine pyrophosphatase-like HAD family hydrolase
MFKDGNENYRLKIAFDYDGTLTDPLMFLLAQRLIKKGHDVWILTARIVSDEKYHEECGRFGINHTLNSERNLDLIETATELGIANKIIYTNLEEKRIAFEEYHFDLLFDDDAEWHCNPICEVGGVAVNV